MRLGVACLALLFGVFSGCSSTPRHAPVSDRAPVLKKVPGSTLPTPKFKEADWRPPVHTVQKGDTLYGIALEYGFDYKELAEWNSIPAPYIIRVGQPLRLASSQQDGVVTTPLKSVASVAESSPAIENRPLAQTGSLLKTQPKAVKIAYSAKAEVAPAAAAPVVSLKQETTLPKTQPAAEERPRVPEARLPAKVSEDKPAAVANEDKKPSQPSGGDDDDLEWGWPAKGKVIASFNEGANLKGVDISGKTGQPVFASAPGKVVYSGSGLRGYGKLVIIKHNKTYLSAYAHNNLILVKEGQTVLKGQRIAEMGDSDSDQVKLHFEIRRLGKPVDPVKYLPETSG